MAISTTFKTPTMVIDGETRTVNRTQWAKLKLSAEDFAKYQAAETREELLWAEAEKAGDVERVPQFEVRDGKRYFIGTTTVFHQGFGIPGDVEYHEFYQQYLDDPDLTWPA
jgi:hypothetical protein